MEIAYLGHSSFRIKGKEVNLVTDPFGEPELGFRFPKVEADIVTVSHDHLGHNSVNLVGGNPFVIYGPGEYEIKGASIFGLNSFHLGPEDQPVRNTIYIIEMEGFRVCHLGDLGELLSDEQLEEINDVDILMLPVGGVYTLDPQKANELVSKIDPRIILPMHYKTSGMGKRYNNCFSLADALKELGAAIDLTPVAKLTVTRDRLPVEERQVVSLERKSS